MALSPSALAEIRGELDSLHRLKDRIDGRVAALEAILSPFELGDIVIAKFPETTTTTPPTFGLRPVESAPTTTANNGLRAAIRDVLTSMGPKRSSEVSQELERRGFANDSPTPLNTRVYNDLWRMSKAGTVTNIDGLFSISEVEKTA